MTTFIICACGLAVLFLAILAVDFIVDLIVRDDEGPWSNM